MSILIFVLSLILLVAAAASGYASLDILPTSTGVLYALAGTVAACAAVVTFALAVLISRIDRLTKFAGPSDRRSILRPGFGVTPSAEPAPAAGLATSHWRRNRTASTTWKRLRTRARSTSIAPAICLHSRRSKRSSRLGRASGAAEHHRQLFVGRGQLQDFLRRLDRGRDERGNVPVRLHGRLQTASRGDKSTGGVDRIDSAETAVKAPAPRPREVRAVAGLPTSGLLSLGSRRGFPNQLAF